MCAGRDSHEWAPTVTRGQCDRPGGVTREPPHRWLRSPHTVSSPAAAVPMGSVSFGVPPPGAVTAVAPPGAERHRVGCRLGRSTLVGCRLGRSTLVGCRLGRSTLLPLFFVAALALHTLRPLCHTSRDPYHRGGLSVPPRGPCTTAVCLVLSLPRLQPFAPLSVRQSLARPPVRWSWCRCHPVSLVVAAPLAGPRRGC